MSENVLYNASGTNAGTNPVFVYASEPVKINFLEGKVEPVPVQNLSKDGSVGLFSKLSASLNKLAFVFATIGILFVLIAYLPDVLNLAQGANFDLSGKEVEELSVGHPDVNSYQPAFDPKLPKTNKITIPSIGVNSEIQEATLENHEDALRKGVWRVSDFGAPNARQMPTILAAHRYGYLAWTWNFRKTSSFMNLPKAKVGDTVTIVWQQRKYIYEIYGESEGDQITDYSADLVLYTCESLTGPVRIFKYARLIEV